MAFRLFSSELLLHNSFKGSEIKKEAEQGCLERDIFKKHDKDKRSDKDLLSFFHHSRNFISG
jgi:hypothetical protein